jgi:hypothetical protein
MFPTYSILMSIYNSMENQTSYYFDQKPTKPNFLEASLQQQDGHMVMTNVYKPIKYKYVNIDTRFCDVTSEYITNITNLSSTSWNDDYMISLPERITGIKSMKIKSADIPLMMPNIWKEMGNHCLYIFEDTTNTEITITVPNGVYTEETLITTLNELINTQGYNITFSVDSNSYTQVQNQSGKDVTLTWYKQSEKHQVHWKQTLGYMLGFRKHSTTCKTMETITSHTYLHIHPIHYVYLVMDEFGSVNSVSKSFLGMLPTHKIQKNIMAKISIQDSMSTNSYLHVNEYTGLISEKRTYMEKINLQRIKIQLLNEWGIVIPLQGFDYSFVLEIEYE